MPRAFSSGALSMSAYPLKLALQPSASLITLVIAAVSVVLPWSTWPTVPMFTCGFVRCQAPSAMWRSAPTSAGAGTRLLAAAEAARRRAIVPIVA